MQTITCDIAILGGGPGGYAAVLRAGLRGASVCLVESGHIGGTCLNVGCIPSKAMLHASELCWQSRQAGQFGFVGGGWGVDGVAFMTRVAKVIEPQRKGIESLLAARKVHIVRGRGQLTGPKSLSVSTDEGPLEVHARSIILAAGSRPTRPAMFPFADPRVMTTDESMTAGDLPGGVIIVGGGIIGCEMATMHAELGIPTTVIEMLDRLATVLEPEASRVIARSLSARGAKVLTSTRITACTAGEAGVTCHLESGESVTAERVIVAVGRGPNVDDIGLEEAGVAVEGGLVVVDDHCRTNVPGVYAVGDMAERRQYAHLATRMGLVAADNACGIDASDDRTVVPAGVYTHPEVAMVGMTQESAIAAGLEVKTASFPYLASGMARAYGQTEGAVKLVAEKSGNLLGATVIGAHATDLIQELALALRAGLSVEDVAATIHAHPTFVEAIGEAAESWLGLPLHTLR